MLSIVKYKGSKYMYCKVICNACLIKIVQKKKASFTGCKIAK